MNNNDGRSASSSFLWKFVERIGTQGILFVISIIVARILSPKEYGVIAIQMVFINLANVITQNGLNISLVQKKDTDILDYSTAFVLSLIVSTFFYAIIYFCAPAISFFYDMPELTNSLRVLASTLFINAFLVIQNAYITRNMLFKELSLCGCLSSLCAGIVAIFLAMEGLGLWALVTQQIVSNLILCLLIYYFTKWKPSFRYSAVRAKSIIKFGLPIAGAYFLDALYSDIRSLVIGKKFTSEQLGSFERGKQFPRIITANVSSTIQAILLPVISRNNNNITIVRNQMAKAIRIIYIFVMPLMIVMGITSHNLVVVLLSEKWIECVPLLCISCFMCVFWPLHAINTQVLVALGHSKQRLHTEIITKILDVLILVITVVCFHTVQSIAVGAALASLLSAIVYAYPCRQHLNYGFLKQISNLLPILTYSVIVGACVFSLDKILAGTSAFILLVQYIVGSIVYFLLIFVFSRSMYYELRQIFFKK